jgi:superfamily II DNA/RNA helicase
VIATPGRLLDFLNMGAIDLSKIRNLVLDEADRMLEMGFEEQVRDILSSLPEQKQTALFSATWPTDIEELAITYLQKPAHVRVEQTIIVPTEIDQRVELARGRKVMERAFELLTGEFKDTKALVFVREKFEADFLHQELQGMGIRSQVLHGGRTQAHRDQAMETFRTGRIRVLVATDVASRGLDVRDIGLVLNVGWPQNEDTYVHRVGRTGRAGASGTAITILQDGHSPSTSSAARSALELLKKAGATVDPEALQYLTSLGGLGLTDRTRARFRSASTPASSSGFRDSSRGAYGSAGSRFGSGGSSFGGSGGRSGGFSGGYGSDRGSGGFGGGGFGGSGGFSDRGSGFSDRGSGRSDNVVCYRCGGQGHRASTCTASGVGGTSGRTRTPDWADTSRFGKKSESGSSENWFDKK